MYDMRAYFMHYWCFSGSHWEEHMVHARMLCAYTSIARQYKGDRLLGNHSQKPSHGKVSH